jgi:imidazolonepropionase-like amidohydrolase
MFCRSLTTGSVLNRTEIYLMIKSRKYPGICIKPAPPLSTQPHQKDEQAMTTQFIHAGALIDGSGGPITQSVLLTIDDGSISAITPFDPSNPPDPALVTDLSYAILVPPFIDCRVHLAFSGTTDLALRKQQKTAAFNDARAVIKRHIVYLFRHGVLAVRDAGDSSGHVLRYMAESRGSDEEPVVVQVAGQAEKNGNMTMANGSDAVQRALETGCRAIVQGQTMGRENLQRMAETQTVLVPTLYAMKALVEAAATADGKKTVAEDLARQLEQVALAKELGIPVAIGTDSGALGVLHGEAVVEEMKLLLKAGYTLAEAVRCATSNSAQLLDMDAGRIAVGKPAHFLVARGTPAQLPRKFAYLEDIYLDGKPSPFYRKNPIRGVF